MDFDENKNMPRKNTGTGKLPFKNILSDLMKERRLTVKQVASLANVAPSVVQNWLEGKTPHDLTSVDMLSQKLGIPFRKLLLGLHEAIDAQTTVDQMFDESEFFEGLVRLKITKLKPKEKV